MTIFFDEKEREDSLSFSTYVQQLCVPQAKKGKRKINMKSQMPSPPTTLQYSCNSASLYANRAVPLCSIFLVLLVSYITLLLL